MQKWVAAMSEETIIAQCSPTMAGLKTGNLFSERFSNKKEFLNRLRRFNAVLVPRGARLLPLKFEGARVLVYMYRPARLKKDLSNALAVQILSERNYPIEHPEHCLKELIRRLNTNDHFPHEIGLFLGYPPEDVHGFIENMLEPGRSTAMSNVLKINLLNIKNVRKYTENAFKNRFRLIS